MKAVHCIPKQVGDGKLRRQTCETLHTGSQEIQRSVERKQVTHSV